MSYSSFHNGDKDGDQNNDLPYDQFFDTVDILAFLQLWWYLIYKSSTDELDLFWIIRNMQIVVIFLIS